MKAAALRAKTFAELEKLGFRFEGMMRLENDETELKLFADEHEP